MPRLRILMYHAIGERGEEAARFVLPRSAFAAQMSLLAGLRFHVLDLEEAVGLLHAGERLPRRALALTFDDGTHDFASQALPVLERHDYPATAFVVTRAMGEPVGWTEHDGIAGRATLAWEEALALPELVKLQPHTRTHASLRTLDPEAVVDEIAGSRRDLEEKTGRPARLFAYPYGHYNETVAAAAEAAGFVAACSVRPGTNDASTPRYELRRDEVRGDTSLRRFAALILGRS